MKAMRAWVVAAIVLALIAGIFLLVFTGEGTLAQKVNGWIDNLSAVGIRLLELPAIMLLAGAAALGVLSATIVLRWGTRSRRVGVTRLAAGGLCAVVLAILALAVDRKIAHLESQVRTLRAQLSDERLARMETQRPVTPAPPQTPDTPATPPATAVTPPPSVNPQVAASTPAPRVEPAPVAAAAPTRMSKRERLLFDLDKVQRNLGQWGEFRLRPVVVDNVTDVAQVRFTDPPVVTYMAVVDLTAPGLEIVVSGSLRSKTLTSAWSREQQVTLAINGEAGNSPRADSGLGVWQGHLRAQGVTILQETPGNPRPFIWFDRANRGGFRAMSAPDRTVPPDAYNLIWGRLDGLLEDLVQAPQENIRQPRTAMGLNADGTRLFLLVVDGRQTQYSLGFTRGEVGLMMHMFGARNAMLCDEGGSACMYVKELGGIINSPSDGQERPTYTHIGIRVR